MIEIFLDLVPVSAFRRWKLKKGGKFFLKLSGISISSAGGELTVEPVYLPLINIDRRGSLVYIEIGRGRPRLLIVVSPSKPYLHFTRVDTIDLED